MWAILSLVVAITAAIFDAIADVDAGGRCSVALADFSLKLGLSFSILGFFIPSGSVQKLAMRLLTMMYGGYLFKGVSNSRACT